MKTRRLNIVSHRDIGYFLSGLILVYCVSGLALNHVDTWNPDFIVVKKSIRLPHTYEKAEITPEVLLTFGSSVGERDYKIHDFPTVGQVKLYYDNASMLVDFTSGEGVYEKVTRRPLIFQSNILHRNSVKGWKWVSDIFSFLLITLNLTGLFILQGKNGLGGRGKWLVATGMLPPVIAVLVFEWVQR